ncbi:MAG: peptidylprolyl isomerase [Rhodobacterales bacterium]|nr:MAG: peptidylprolyl isomerase [Rhodobacterales bacterium]
MSMGMFAEILNHSKKLGAVALLAGLGLAAPVSAQNLFDPVIRIDNEVITRFDMKERIAFLTALGAPGDVRSLASEQLQNELIQLRLARQAGVTATEEQIVAGMEEFAARGTLSLEQLQEYLAQRGISPQTFRDFISAGVIWREYVRAELIPTVSISQADIDAAMAEAEPEPGVKVLLSEIVLPAPDPASRKASKARAERLRSLDAAGFADAARRMSISLSRNTGGEMNWVDIRALPPATAAAVRGLAVGKVSRIVETPEDVRLYLLRDRDTVRGGTPKVMVEYAALLLPGGRSDANLRWAKKLAEQSTSCDDFYPVARTLGDNALIREERPENAVPAPYGAELRNLDPGEVSTNLVSQSGAQVVLMLCKRGNELPRSLTREMVETQLKNQRIGTAAQFLLEDFKANARIEYVN